MSGRNRMDGRQRTALVSVVAASFLVAIKLVTGILTGSLGLIADAVHSGTDLVAALLTFFAVRVSARPPDADHPYGHGRAEHLTALAEGAFLVVASGLIVFTAIGRLAGDAPDVDAAWYALAVLGVVIVVDASRALVSWRASRRYGSPALAANALHFASDLGSSLAVLTGLLLVRAGYPEADAVAALLVSGLVVVAAIRLGRTNVNVLMDRAPEAAVSRAERAVREAEPGAELRRLRVRESAGRHFVDAVIAIDPDAALGQGHAVADGVEAAVRDVLPDSDVVVHVEPAEPGDDLRERATAAAQTVRGIREVHNVRVTTVAGRPELSLHVKLPGRVPLAEAHAAADAVEEAIRAACPGLETVHTHIEPLSDERSGRPAPDGEAAGQEARIAEVVRDATGRDPASVRLRRDAAGLSVLLTVLVPGSLPLAEAHAVATRVETMIRGAVPEAGDIVVHTEPDEPEA